MELYTAVNIGDINPHSHSPDFLLLISAEQMSASVDLTSGTSLTGGTGSTSGAKKQEILEQITSTRCLTFPACLQNPDIVARPEPQALPAHVLRLPLLDDLLLVHVAPSMPSHGGHHRGCHS